MYLINGESKQSVDFSDRGFQYGDGLFETIEVLDGTPIFLTQHLQRLYLGCDKLLIPTPDNKVLNNEVCQLSQNADKAVLKLIITRGSGGRGYRQPDTIQPTRLLSVHPFPDYSEPYEQKGIRVRFCDTRLGINPSLAGIKHMNRLEQVMARSEWGSAEIQEGLMLDVNDNVIEGTMSNIFLNKDNVIYTPEIHLCGVAGVIRQILIQLAKQNQIKVIEKTLNQQQVYDADELFVCNSIIGIWPVKQIEDRQYSIGPVTRLLQKWFKAFKLLETNDC